MLMTALIGQTMNGRVVQSIHVLSGNKIPSTLISSPKNVEKNCHLSTVHEYKLVHSTNAAVAVIQLKALLNKLSSKWPRELPTLLWMKRQSIDYIYTGTPWPKGGVCLINHFMRHFSSHMLFEARKELYKGSEKLLKHHKSHYTSLDIWKMAGVRPYLPVEGRSATPKNWVTNTQLTFQMPRSWFDTSNILISTRHFTIFTIFMT